VKTTRRFAFSSAVALFLACGSSPAHTPQPVADLAPLIAELEAAHEQVSLAQPAARDEAEARAAGALQALIDAAPADDRAPTWMLDLATLSLAPIYRRCDDASVFFGLPTPEQLRRVAESSQSVLTLVNRAEAAANAAISRLEASLLAPGLDPESAVVLADRIEPVLTRLVDSEIGARIPLLRIDATALAAAAFTDHAAASRRRTEALALIGAMPAAGACTEVHKRLLSAAMLVRAPTPTQRDAARRQLEGIVSNVAKAAPGQASSALPPDEWIRLHMALNRCGEAATSARLPCPGRGTDWLVDLLLAESAFVAANVAPAHAANDARAVAAIKLLDVNRAHGGGDADLDSTAEFSALRRLVYEKLAAATASGTHWDSLDPEVALARAWALSTALPDSKRDAEAQSLLTQLVARDDADMAVRARALWMLSAASPSPRTHLAALVRLHPSPRLAAPAASRLLTLVRPREDSSYPCRYTWPDDDSRRDAEAALTVLSRIPDHDGRIIEVLIAAAVSSTVPSVDDLDRAQAHFGTVPPDASSRPQLTSCITSAFDRALNAAGDPANQLALYRRLENWLEHAGDDLARARLTRLDRAELSLASQFPAQLDSPAAVAAELQPLLGSDIDASGFPSRARLRVTLGRALRAAGDPVAAVPLLRSVADDFEPDARGTDAARAPARQSFWNAWAELIEIVRAGEVDANTADDAERARHAQRLRERLELLDPELGGEPWAGRIRAASGRNSK